MSIFSYIVPIAKWCKSGPWLCQIVASNREMAMYTEHHFEVVTSINQPMPVDPQKPQLFWETLYCSTSTEFLSPAKSCHHFHMQCLMHSHAKYWCSTSACSLSCADHFSTLSYSALSLSLSHASSTSAFSSVLLLQWWEWCAQKCWARERDSTESESEKSAAVVVGIKGGWSYWSAAAAGWYKRGSTFWCHVFGLIITS